MDVQGAIYFHKRLIYKDGSPGEKLLILLNSPTQNESYLFVKTTSRRKNRPITPGCIKSESLYFLPAGKSSLPLDTWIQLEDIWPIEKKDIIGNPEVSRKGELSHQIIKDIINCLFLSREKDLEPIWKRLIRPTEEESLQKLKEKFSKK